MSAAPMARGSFLWGPLTHFALAVAVAAAAIDQAVKLWLCLNSILGTRPAPAGPFLMLQPHPDMASAMPFPQEDRWDNGFCWH